MSYIVRVDVQQADGTNTKKDRTSGSAYKILSSGVLQLIEFNAEKDRWEVTEELAPQAWYDVSGTRFAGGSEYLKGHDGVIANGEYGH